MANLSAPLDALLDDLCWLVEGVNRSHRSGCNQSIWDYKKQIQDVRGEILRRAKAAEREPFPRVHLDEERAVTITAQASHRPTFSELIIVDADGKSILESEDLTEAEAEEIAFRINAFAQRVTPTLPPSTEGRQDG